MARWSRPTARGRRSGGGATGRTAARSIRPGIPATRKRVEFEGADFHEYRDGKLARLRIVFDMAQVSRQLGLLPAPGSLGERAMVLAQQLRTGLRPRLAMVRRVCPGPTVAYMTATTVTRNRRWADRCPMRTRGPASATRWRTRRPGIFEGLPRRLYRGTRARYLEGCAWGIVINGVVVSGFGVIVVALYVDVDPAVLALFAACSALGFAGEGGVAARYLFRSAQPARSWLAHGLVEDASADAWLAAARMPAALLRRPSLYAIGAAGAGAADLVLASLLGLPAYQAAWLFPMSYLLYLSSVVLRYVALELAMRPLLEDIGRTLPRTPRPEGPRVSLHKRLLATLPMVTWGAALTVSGLLAARHRDFADRGREPGCARGNRGFSIWLSLVLGDSVSGPIIDLRDATRRLAAGDLDLRVPVVSTDEVGELAAAFNAMVNGLSERERLREAFGAFVDPTLTERVLAEGTDLRGEELEVSILFLDVRGFTEFAHRVPAPRLSHA